MAIKKRRKKRVKGLNSEQGAVDLARKLKKLGDVNAAGEILSRMMWHYELGKSDALTVANQHVADTFGRWQQEIDRRYQAGDYEADMHSFLSKFIDSIRENVAAGLVFAPKSAGISELIENENGGGTNDNDDADTDVGDRSDGSEDGAAPAGATVISDESEEN